MAARTETPATHPACWMKPWNYVWHPLEKKLWAAPFTPVLLLNLLASLDHVFYSHLSWHQRFTRRAPIPVLLPWPWWEVVHQTDTASQVKLRGCLSQSPSMAKGSLERQARNQEECAMKKGISSQHQVLPTAKPSLDADPPVASSMS